MDPVKEKRTLLTQRRVRWALAACALAALVVALPALVGGCGSGENEADSSSSATPSSKRVVLNITVEDATTQDTRTDRFVLNVPGDSAWTPDLRWGSAGRAFGEYQVGRERVFYVRPDSASGRRIEVPFEMQPDMISGVAASVTHVAVYDDSVVAHGPAIPGGRRSFAR